MSAAALLARLLQRRGLRMRCFGALPQRLRAGDLLILNDSRVLPARLFAVRAGLTTQAGSPVPSGAIEVLLIERDEEAEASRRERVACAGEAGAEGAHRRDAAVLWCERGRGCGAGVAGRGGSRG